MLHELQACPRCFVLAQRQDGCSHLVCRCGCDFCFGCGAPHDTAGYANTIGYAHVSGCICPDLVEDPDNFDGEPHLAAWLQRAVPHAEPSIKACLESLPWMSAMTYRRAEARVQLEEDVRENSATLGSWLWRAGANVGPLPTEALPTEDAHEEFAFLADSQEQRMIRYVGYEWYHAEMSEWYHAHIDLLLEKGNGHCLDFEISAAPVKPAPPSTKRATNRERDRRKDSTPRETRRLIRLGVAQGAWPSAASRESRRDGRQRQRRLHRVRQATAFFFDDE